MAPNLLLLVLLGTFGQLSSAEVRGPPRINGPIEKQHQKTPVGSTVRLRCPVIAHPPALTMWQKDGETINNIWERFKVKEAGLRIENVVKEDSGQYICRGTNGFGTVSINFTLRVIDESDPPVIEPQIPSSGEDVVLERGGEASDDGCNKSNSDATVTSESESRDDYYKGFFPPLRNRSCKRIGRRQAMLEWRELECDRLQLEQERVGVEQRYMTIRRRRLEMQECRLCQLESRQLHLLKEAALQREQFRVERERLVLEVLRLKTEQERLNLEERRKCSSEFQVIY